MTQQNNSVLITSRGRRIEGVADNTNDEVIAITKAKAKLVYRDFADRPVKDSIGFWFGLAFACFVAATTTEPRDVYDISGSGNVIHLCFWIGSIVFFLFFLYSCYGYFKTRDLYSEDAFVKALRPDGHEE